MTAFVITGARSSRRRFRRLLGLAGVRTVTVHAGRVKTGSTHLQSCLAHNRARLEVDGWLFPSSLGIGEEIATRFGRLRSSGHCGIVSLARGRTLSAGSMRRFEEELAAGAPNLLVSAENIGRDPSEGLVAAVSELFGDLDTTFVMYLRRPSDWIVSVYTEMVTGFHQREVRTFEALKPDLLRAADVTGFVYQIERARTGVRIRFRSYDHARRTNGGLRADFSSCLGLSALAPPADERANPSPGIAATRIVRRFNALTAGLGADEYARLYGKLLEIVGKRIDDVRGSLLQPEAQERIDLEWLDRNGSALEAGELPDGHRPSLVGEGGVAPAPDAAALEAELLPRLMDLLEAEGVHGFAMRPLFYDLAQELGRRAVGRIGRDLRRLPGA